MSHGGFEEEEERVERALAQQRLGLEQQRLASVVELHCMRAHRGEAVRPHARTQGIVGKVHAHAPRRG
eukprot:975066-Prymnesium_polylepis.1